MKDIKLKINCVVLICCNMVNGFMPCFAEITKDSSGSVSASGPENFSDDEDADGHSSTSGIVSSQQSPITPEPQFFDGPQSRNFPASTAASGGAGFKPLARQRDGSKPHHVPQAEGDWDSPRERERERMSSAKGKDKERPASGSQRPGAKDQPAGHPATGRTSPHAADSRPRSRKRDSRSPEHDSKRRDYFEVQDRYRAGFRSPQVGDLSVRSDASSYQELLDNNAIVPNKIRDDIPDSDLIDYEDDGGESLIESVELEYDDPRVRIFIALFDYDPTLMSPNPDAADEELPFKEGQLIKVGFCRHFIHMKLQVSS